MAKKIIMIIILVLILVVCFVLIGVDCKAFSDKYKKTTTSEIQKYLRIYDEQTDETYVEWYGDNIVVYVYSNGYEAYNYKGDDSMEYYSIATQRGLKMQELNVTIHFMTNQQIEQDE